jgi:hypothetical protein
MELLALLDHQAMWVLLATRETLVLWAQWDPEVTRAQLEMLAAGVQLVLLELKDQRAHEVMQALKGREGLQDHQVPRERLGLLEPTVMWVMSDHLVTPGHLVIKDQVGHKGQGVHKVTLETHHRVTIKSGQG